MNLVAATLNSGGNQGGFRTEPAEHLVTGTLAASGAGSDRPAGQENERDMLIFESRFARNDRGKPEAVCPLLKAQSGEGGKGDAAPLVFDNSHQGPSASCVRRLTPREAERLQGFSDDYTLIEYRGKPAKDGPRYRALGNAMAVPVVRWIGERIEQVERIIGEEKER